MRDKRFKGHQNFGFEASLEDDGVYGARQMRQSPFRLVKSGEVHSCCGIS